MFTSTLLLCLFSVHSSLSSSLLEQSLFKLLPLEDRLQIVSLSSPIAVRYRRSLDNAFMGPIGNLSDVDDPAFNLSSIESDFFHLPRSEFHKRIYNQFEKVQARVFNESLLGIQDDIRHMNHFNSTHLKPENRVKFLHKAGPDYERKEETYRIPSNDGVQIVRKGLRKYKNNMENWVEQTFVHKPKSVVRDEKSKLQNGTTQSQDKNIPLNKLEKLWGFEREFDALMRKYQKEMTSNVFDRYDRMYHTFLDHEDDFLNFPRSPAALEAFILEDQCAHGGPCENDAHRHST